MKKTSILILFALLAIGPLAWAQQQFSGGSGTEADPYQLSSVNDWNTFADNVNNGTTYSGQYFKMTADIGSVSEMVGKNKNNSFQGIFNGNGHTLTFNKKSKDDYVAPFRYINNATIMNLHVTGKLEEKNNNYAVHNWAGIVAAVYGRSDIISCRSSVKFDVEFFYDDNSFPGNNLAYHGGLIASIKEGPVNILNCLFDGEMYFLNQCASGGIMGGAAVQEDENVSIINCLIAPKKVTLKYSKFCGTIDGGGDHFTNFNIYYTKTIGESEGIDASSYSQDHLLQALGNGWNVVNGELVPKTSPEVNSPEPLLFPFTGEGTEASPYVIASTDDWRSLVINAIASKTVGKHYKLVNDIQLTETVTSSVPTTMLGINKYVSFQGTFDGNGHTLTLNYTDNSDKHYCAPFRIINGATIKNLHVDGTIRKENKKHAGGFVGQAHGNNHIINCRSSVDIQANTDGDGSHGGFIGDLRNGNTYFENCLFDGKLRGTNGASSPTTKWGGFVGWVAKDDEAYFTNCVFAPTAINIESKGSSNTFARSKNSGDVHFTRSYYCTAFGTTQGKHAPSIIADEHVSMTPAGTSNTNVCGITFYSLDGGNYNPCFMLDNVLYAGSGDIVKLNLSQVGTTPEGASEGKFIAVPGFISGTDSPYNLSMPNNNVSITLAPADWNTHEGTEADPYPIYNAEQWALLCSRVNSNTSTYSGKYFKLMADIMVEETNETGNPSKMVGISENVNFRGTFDGNGHTMTVNYTSYNGDNYCAPFRIVRNATIKNLHVTGSIYKAHGKHAAGIVGQSFGTVHITNCRSSVDISSYTDGDGSHGGIVGDVRDCSDDDDLYLENCLFDGKLRTTNNTIKWGGLIGWVTDESDDPDAYITNCLFAPQEVDQFITTNSDSRTFARYDDGNDFHLINSYYKTLIGNEAQGGVDASSYENTALRTKLGDGWEIVTEDGVEKVVPVMTLRELNGEGTAESPYLIATALDWEALSVNVYLGQTYNGAYFLMTDDISTDRMVGIATSDANSFQGTFDGDGHTLAFTADVTQQVCAPFRCVKDATIKKLHTIGTITTTNNMAGGITGRTYGTTVITNCISSMEISKTTSGDGSSGGLVSNVTGGTLSLTDCLFNGSLLGSGSTSCGGLVGWTNQAASVTVTNCLFAPTNVTMSTSNSYTLVRCQDNNASFNNSYYTQTFGTVQGIDGIGMNNETLRMNLGEAWENLGGQVKPIMGIHSFEEGDGTEESPYLIASEDDWNRLASNAYLGETYYAEYFKMTADISVSRMVGTKTTGSNYFRGIFDGDGRKLTFNYTAANDYAAPFRFVANATIKNLHVDGTIVTSAGYAAGIAGETYARTRIENCRSSVIIRSSRTVWGGHGGIVGLKPDQTNAYLTVEGCVFDGKMLSTGATPTPNCGGIVGYTSVANTTIKNCLYAPAALEEGEIEVGGAATFVCGAQFTLTNCYYTREIGSNQGKQVHSITLIGDIVSMAFAGNEIDYNVSGITTCGTGLKYGDVFYAGNQDAVSLNLTTPYGNLIESVTYTPQVEGGTATAIVPNEMDAYSFTMPDADVIIHVTTVAGYTREVKGYGDSDGGYVLIASPVGTVKPEDVDQMFANEYDLYRFNQAADLEWENYKQEGDNYHFDLEPGKGYLYANSEDVTLVFPGEAYNGTGQVTLSKTGNGDFAGWNLVGNPYADIAYIADGRPFYTMNSDGSEIIVAEDNSIVPMEGVFVIAASDGETMDFTTTDPEVGSKRLVLNLSKCGPSTLRGVSGTTIIDRAIVRFGEGSQLPKFQMKTNSTKLYIQQNNMDYAVVNAERAGEMPVNFKAKENGTYTLTISEGIVIASEAKQSNLTGFSYLHLIDNLTGADIDLLQTPSYTFDSKVTDYESRFKLVFEGKEDSYDNLDNNDNFAYFNNGELIINGEGRLEVIDMLGHILLCREVHSDFCLPTSNFLPSGVYVLRLINGTDVKSQKIVVR